MNLTNVRLILARELRDQLRDRRTLFMIFVLPVLLYPLLGVAYFQMVQFQTQKPMNVLVIGGGELASSPTPLIENDGFSPRLFADGELGAELLKLDLVADLSPSHGATPTLQEQQAEASRLVQLKTYDAAVVFPPDFAKQVEAYRRAILDDAGASGSRRAKRAETPIAEIPRPKIIYTTANERSQIAFARLNMVLDHWTEEVGKKNLIAGGISTQAVHPFEVDSSDLAEKTSLRGANLWSRILPILLLLWAMTGAFYPAVDLCAGEKERGTLETLLSSPAERSEIVVGKLLTVMVFSMLTAALNLISVGTTGTLIFHHLEGVGGPPLLSIVWLAAASIPVSALFSALCIALASFARSTREGQYYLMPLLMISLPLAMMPMSPGVELNLGNSLIPISGIVLLLKTLLEGSYLQALQYLPVVLAVTLAACWLAVRWAVEQFNSESVLFREGERFSVGMWVRQLMRDRRATPSAAQATVCGIVILMVSFIFRSSIAAPDGFNGFARVTVTLQLMSIALPALLMASILTSSPRRTLLLRLPHWPMIPAAAVLAVGLHPFIMAATAGIERLYPISSEMKHLLDGMESMFASANAWYLILALAVVPAICEEIAFRGFILSGFRGMGNNWRAIVLSAVFFGVTHGFLQQSINACLLGIVLGYLAVQSSSLLPGIVFHLLHNTLTVASTWITPAVFDRYPSLGMLMRPVDGNGPAFLWPVYFFGGLISLLVLYWLVRFPQAGNAREARGNALEQTAIAPSPAAVECYVSCGLD